MALQTTDASSLRNRILLCFQPPFWAPWRYRELGAGLGRDTKGTFHAKVGSIKDRSVRDLTEADDIKKRWQEYTEELYKKGLHDPDNHDGVITHLDQTSWNPKLSGP